MKVLFVASEGLPFSKTGGMADVVEALPKSLVTLGHEVAVMLPAYRDTRTKGVILPKLEIAMGPLQRKVALLDGGVLNGVHYYFVDDPEYFHRPQLYGEGGKDYPDNAERYAEFCRATIEFAKRVWMPDIFHCHDWQSALIPVLLGTEYADDKQLEAVRSIFTIHNLGYQGLFARDVMEKIGLPADLFHVNAMEFYGRVGFLKGALVFADYLTTVSRRYAQEIQTPDYGHGLDGVVRSRSDRLVGILNGVDYTVWSPGVDNLIAKKYSPRDLSGKLACKKNLLEVFGFAPEAVTKPLIGIVSRFANQKGFDLIADVAPQLLAEDLAMVVLGTGEPKYEKMFQELTTRYPSKIGVRVAYDEALAHTIEAGADAFLMPSRYEPCGLNQIYSLRYGTVPIVRATGGLDDTVEAIDVKTGRGTGFKFQEYDGAVMLGAVREALALFRSDPVMWRRIQIKGMTKDFSWRPSAIEYAKLYETVSKSRNRKAAVTSN